MPKGLGQIFREASELPERDRATLAGLLIESLDSHDDSEVEVVWEREVGRRIAELDEGSVETVPWEEVRRQLFGRQDGDYFHPAASTGSDHKADGAALLAAYRIRRSSGPQQSPCIIL